MAYSRPTLVQTLSVKSTCQRSWARRPHGTLCPIRLGLLNLKCRSQYLSHRSPSEIVAIDRSKTRVYCESGGERNAEAASCI